MKAVRVDSYGAAPTIEEIPVPEIATDEVLIRVRAASLNPLDVKLRSGKMHHFFPLTFPYTLGTDLSGTVVSTGAGVTQWRQGDAVIARADPVKGGALAEYAVVPASFVTRAPSKVSLENAAGIPTAVGTSWQALFEAANLERGQTVLIHAGAGGVGSFAVQLARYAGARVIATASGSNTDLVSKLGADQVIDYRAVDFARELSDVDIVLDTLGGETQQRSLEVLRAGGQLLALTQPPDEALAKAYKVTARFVFHSSDGRRLETAVGLFDTGALRVLVDREVTLSEMDAALEHQASGRARGKIIVILESSA
jgi:NADPH:quinone reductase-like Zn-dependent oxidoreductase